MIRPVATSSAAKRGFHGDSNHAYALWLSGSHGQKRLTALKGLDLCLLFHTKHQGVGGRIEVKANHIAYLVHEVWIYGPQNRRCSIDFLDPRRQWADAVWGSPEGCGTGLKLAKVRPIKPSTSGFSRDSHQAASVDRLGTAIAFLFFYKMRLTADGGNLVSPPRNKHEIAMMNPKRNLVTLILLSATVALTPKAAAIADEPKSKQLVSVETIYGDTWLELEADAAGQAGLESPFQSRTRSTAIQDNQTDQDEKKDENGLPFQSLGFGSIERSNYLMNPGGSSAVSVEVPRISAGSYRPAEWSGVTAGASSQFGHFPAQMGDWGSNLVVPASAVVSQPTTQSSAPVPQLRSRRPIYSDVSESSFEGGRVSRVVPIPETNAIAPLLAVIGVVVAGPFIRRCIHP